MNTLVRPLILAAALVVGASPFAHGQSASVIEVPINGPGQWSISSRDGTFAANWQASTVPGFRWSVATGPIPYGALPTGINVFDPIASDDDGSVLFGQVSTDTNDPWPGVPARFTSGSGIEVLPLPQASPGGFRVTDASSDMGTIVGDAFISMPATIVDARAVRWTLTGQPEFLGSLPGGSGLSEARACSDDASVIVGRSSATGTGSRAFVWTDAVGIRALPIAAGVTLSDAYAVSADGSTIFGRVTSGSGVGGWRVVRWDSGGAMEELGGAPSGSAGGATPGIVMRCSADGSSVMWNTSSGPWIWNAAMGAVRFSDYLEVLEASIPNGLLVGYLSGLSDDGDTVYGLGVVMNGQSAGFRAALDDDVLGTTICDPAVPNSTGQPGRLTAIGSNVAADNRVTLYATSLPPNALSLLIVAPTTGMVAQPGGSQGVLCLGGTIGRYVPQAFVTSSRGEGGHSVDLTAIPRATGTQATLPGDSWVFQLRHRDSNPGSTSNFTRAVSVTFR